MDASVVIWRLVGAGLSLAPLYFVVVPWITRDWPRARATVVEVVRENPDGLYARYRKYKDGKDWGIEYEVRGQRYRKNPNIEMITKADGLPASSVSLIYEEFEVRYHPDSPNRYSIAHAYKPWAKWTIIIFCLGFGSAAIWSTI